jgi:hypothetical protein
LLRFTFAGQRSKLIPLSAKWFFISSSALVFETGWFAVLLAAQWRKMVRWLKLIPWFIALLQFRKGFAVFLL